MGFIKGMKENKELKKLNLDLEELKSKTLQHTLGRYGLTRAVYVRMKEECNCKGCGRSVKGELVMTRGNSVIECRGCARKLINKVKEKDIQVRGRRK